MFNRIARPNGNGKLQMVVVALIMVILFIASFQISRMLMPSTRQPASSPAAANSNMSGVAYVNPPHQLQDFTLTSKTGDPIRLSDLRGRAVVLFFGYTHCPDVCPTTLADYKRVKQMLGDEAEQVEFVFVSVDGRRDTPEQVAAYLDQFDPDFVGMTGDEATLRSIGTEFGLIFSAEHVTVTNDHDEHDAHQEHVEQAAPGDEPLDQENYFVQHTSPSFLIDKNGALRMVDFYGTKVDTITASIRQLLRETAQ